MEKGLRRLVCAAGLLGIAAFVLALLLVVLFLVGLNHWQQPVDEELAPAVLALVVIYAVCIAVAIAMLPLAGVCLGTGIYQVCAFAKGELRRRIVVMTVLGLVFPLFCWRLRCFSCSCSARWAVCRFLRTQRSGR